MLQPLVDSLFALGAIPLDPSQLLVELVELFLPSAQLLDLLVQFRPRALNAGLQRLELGEHRRVGDNALSIAVNAFESQRLIGATEEALLIGPATKGRVRQSACRPLLGVRQRHQNCPAVLDAAFDDNGSRIDGKVFGREGVRALANLVAIAIGPKRATATKATPLRANHLGSKRHDQIATPVFESRQQWDRAALTVDDSQPSHRLVVLLFDLFEQRQHTRRQGRSTTCRLEVNGDFDAGVDEGAGQRRLNAPRARYLC